jgi:hypothetical protein
MVPDAGSQFSSGLMIAIPLLLQSPNTPMQWAASHPRMWVMTRAFGDTAVSGAGCTEGAERSTGTVDLSTHDVDTPHQRAIAASQIEKVQSSANGLNIAGQTRPQIRALSP